MLHHENIASFFCIMTILKRFLDEVEGRDGIAQCDKIWKIFPRLGKNLKVLCNLSRVHSIFGKILYQLWKILMLGQVFIVANDQILKN